ncbi:hypothetical protein ASE35_05930 [Lysobacter sp. Root916]|uniref:hypothetical protein n=1 Tax=Lysobacter sp. Root916 TaxID=1736606 RepID=UPI000708B097|nr:hypothetical protein [Lysobacter sp. Root916]KRD39858.1 hypothetical protein ASE35_05930 [Lysobacter sp. Root916]
MSYPLHSIHGYVHLSRIGVLVEFGLETDFAERTEEFRQLAHDIALHIAAMAPADIPNLLSQPFVKYPERTVGESMEEVAGRLRERLAVVRFIRWNTQLAERDGAEPEPPRPPAVAAGLRLIR